MASEEERKEAFLRAWFDAPEGVHWAHGMSNEIEQNVSVCFDKAIAAWTTPVAPVSPDEVKPHQLVAYRFKHRSDGPHMWEYYPLPIEERSTSPDFVTQALTLKKILAILNSDQHAERQDAAVSPDATGKCGELVTIKVLPDQTELVTRSQAVELLAAERAENTRLQSENDAQADQISELQMTPWPEWATKVLAVIRKRSGYDGYGDAIEGVDLPAELDECIAAIEADNAALTARVNFLERTWKKAERRADALEAKLAAAEKALGTKSAANEALSKSVVESIDTEKRLREAAIELDEAISNDFNIFGAQQKLRAVLGGKP